MYPSEKVDQRKRVPGSNACRAEKVVVLKRVLCSKVIQAQNASLRLSYQRALPLTSIAFEERCLCHLSQHFNAITRLNVLFLSFFHHFFLQHTLRLAPFAQTLEKCHGSHRSRQRPDRFFSHAMNLSATTGSLPCKDSSALLCFHS